MPQRSCSSRNERNRFRCRTWGWGCETLRCKYCAVRQYSVELISVGQNSVELISVGQNSTLYVSIRYNWNVSALEISVGQNSNVSTLKISVWPKSRIAVWLTDKNNLVCSWTENKSIMVHNNNAQLFEEINCIMSYNSQIYLDFVFVLPRNNLLLSEIILLLWRGWQEQVFSTSRYERHFLVRIKIWCPVILLMVRIKIRFPAVLLMVGWNHFPISRRRFSQSNLLLVVFKVSDLQQFDQLITPND